ncbi:MAG: L,D-transpeptidase [Arcobacteraceae bacterium]
MIKKVLPLLFMLSSISSVYAANEKYTIAVCVTSSLENALTCKYKVLAENVKLDVFIVKENGKYLTNIGIFADENTAKYAIKSASLYVKKQMPFVKKISNEVVNLKLKNEQFIDLNTPIEEVVMNNEPMKNKTKKSEKIIDLISTYPKAEELQLLESYPFEEGQNLSTEITKKQKKQVVYSKQELEYIEELRQISMDEFDKADEQKESKKAPEKIEKPKEIEKVVEAPKVEKIEKLVDTIEKVQRVTTYEKVEKPGKLQKIEVPAKVEKIEKAKIKKEDNSNPLSNIAKYEEILIEVDSINNYMSVKARIDNQIKDIKTYTVSTGKDNIKKPFGLGKVSKISLNPVWYPTQDTINSFKKRGIFLPNIVPPGNKYNYMGAAKINLTHEVDGKSTYRIHGTLNEKTIGTNESAGCIRMKNNDVVQLATLLNDFADLRSLNDVKVILK